MGNNYKFRLSWLYSKLRDPKTITSKSRSKSSSPQIKARPDVIPPVAPAGDDTQNSYPRKSYHFTRELTSEPHSEHFLVVSAKRESEQHVSLSSLPLSPSTSNPASCSSPPRHRPRRLSPEFRFDRVLTPDTVDKTTSSSSTSSSSASRFLSDPDITANVITVGTVDPLGLSPIPTKKNKKKVVKDAATERRHGSSNRFSRSSTLAKSPGTKIRAHSPRLLVAARRIHSRKGAAGQRRSHETMGKCGGFAVVKSSFDPWRDFRESMAEMIVENRIKESKDLEDLLVCYLLLNSEEYHEVIIAAFKQIWCVLTDIRLNEGELALMYRTT